MEAENHQIGYLGNNVEHQQMDHETFERLAHEVCAICLSPFRLGAFVTATNCLHFFHYACALPHFQQVFFSVIQNVNCPMCIRPIFDMPVHLGRPLIQHLREVAVRLHGQQAGMLSREGYQCDHQHSKTVVCGASSAG